MEFSALDPWKLTALMIVGGVFALAGLWLIFKPKSDGHSMMIHVAGMKLEASSAGVLVFLIGAAFFATPLFVQEEGVNEQLRVSGGQGDPAEESRSGSEISVSTPGNSTVTRPVQTSITNEGRELEPNDTAAAANVISMGSSVQGTIEPGDRDFFYVETPLSEFSEMAVNATSGNFTLRVYDDLGAEIWSGTRGDGGSRTYRGAVEYPAYYISVEIFGLDHQRDYNLSVAARPE